MACMAVSPNLVTSENRNIIELFDINVLHGILAAKYSGRSRELLSSISSMLLKLS